LSEPVVIVGCGGHGREVFSVISAVNDAGGDPWKVAGFLDDAPAEANLRCLDRLGAGWLGPSSLLGQLDVHYVMGIGDPRVRADVAAKLDQLGRPAARLIHPAATIGPANDLADGVVVFAGARITTNVTIGRHVHIGLNATIAHDAILGDCVQLNPQAVISGHCTVGREVLIGANASILQSRTVGDRARVGANACVVRDVGTGTTVKGVPAT
jgi:sugar O-acyltransferase (sialic acid O-acetyltransferase NeuD family)